MWKLLLSRLGLFKELFSDLRGDKKDTDSEQEERRSSSGSRRRQVEHATTRPHTTGVSGRQRIGFDSGEKH